MYVMIDCGEDYFHRSVHVPEEFDDVTEDIIRYLGVISRLEHIQPCWVVTWSMTPLFYEEDDDMVHLSFDEHMRPEDFISVVYSSTGQDRPVPNLPFWDGLPEKVLVYLIDSWAARPRPPRQLPLIRQFKDVKYPPKKVAPVINEEVAVSRFEREELV